MGSVEILIVWENLDCNRILLKNHGSGGKLGVLTLLVRAVCFHVFFRHTEKSVNSVGPPSAPENFPLLIVVHKALSKIRSEICYQNTDDFYGFV